MMFRIHVFLGGLRGAYPTEITRCGHLLRTVDSPDAQMSGVQPWDSSDSRIRPNLARAAQRARYTMFR